MEFDVVFDDDFTVKPMPVPPFVGAGTLSFAGDYNDGSYLYGALPNLNFQFDFDMGEQFTQADTVQYDPSMKIVIYGNGQRFYFDGPPACLNCGALVVSNSSPATLSFAPNTFGTAPFTSYAVSNGTFLSGTYGVPGPMPLLGAAAGFGWSRRLRRRLACAAQASAAKARPVA